MPAKTKKECPDNEEISEKTGKCIKKCGPTMMRNPDTGRCINIDKKKASTKKATTKQTKKGCLENEEISAKTGNCVKKCGPAMMRNPDTGRCIKMDKKRQTIKKSKTKQNKTKLQLQKELAKMLAKPHFEGMDDFREEEDDVAEPIKVLSPPLPIPRKKVFEDIAPKQYDPDRKTRFTYKAYDPNRKTRFSDAPQRSVMKWYKKNEYSLLPKDPIYNNPLIMQNEKLVEFYETLPDNYKKRIQMFKSGKLNATEDQYNYLYAAYARENAGEIDDGLQEADDLKINYGSAEYPQMKRKTRRVI